MISLAIPDLRMPLTPAQQALPLRSTMPEFRLPEAAATERPAPRTFAEAEASLTGAEQQKLDHNARELEGIFMRLLMRRIQGSIGAGAFGESSQSQFMRSMAFDEMGNAMAGGRSGGLGLGRMIYESLVRDEAAKSSEQAPVVEIP